MVPGQEPAWDPGSRALPCRAEGIHVCEPRCLRCWVAGGVGLTCRCGGRGSGEGHLRPWLRGDGDTGQGGGEGTKARSRRGPSAGVAVTGPLTWDLNEGFIPPGSGSRCGRTALPPDSREGPSCFSDPQGAPGSASVLTAFSSVSYEETILGFGAHPTSGMISAGSLPLIHLKRPCFQVRSQVPGHRSAHPGKENRGCTEGLGFGDGSLGWTRASFTGEGVQVRVGARHLQMPVGAFLQGRLG